MPDKNQLNKIHRYLAGECSREEMARIETWIESDPANRQTFEAVKKIWEVEPKKEIQTDLKEAWSRLEEQIEEREEVRADHQIHNLTDRLRRKSRPSGRNVWLRVAAIIVIGLFASLYATNFLSNGTNGESGAREHSEMAMQEVRTERAHQSEMTFSDGTVVRLNAASYIRFPSRFYSDVREVYLEGEAWFDVKHNPDVEFVVHTRAATVRVLGTEFNVKAHTGDPEVEVVVAEGTVAVQAASASLEKPGSEVLLTQGELSRVPSGQSPTAAQPVDVRSYLSWLRGDFVFEEVPFAKVLNEWERRFDVDFEVENETLLATPFTGEFRHESFDEMLRLTSVSLEFSYERNNNTIVIKK